MEKKFNDETLQHEFETIWKELKPKVIARIETEPDWKNKNYKELVNDIYDMTVHNINDVVRDAILFEAARIIFA